MRMLTGDRPALTMWQSIFMAPKEAARWGSPLGRVNMLWALRLLDLHYIHVLCSNSFTCDKLCTALLAFPATPLLPWVQDPSLWYVEVVLSKISIALSIRMTFIYLPTVPVLKATTQGTFPAVSFASSAGTVPRYCIRSMNPITANS